ncbi:MAG: type II toxin-antitoxin system HicA family toxin [Candidatus Edwardsbacteria bacterium]
MKRKELIRQLTEAGCVLYRHGARHDVYINPVSGKKQPVPRHIEIHNKLAKHIKKQLGLLLEKIE